MQGSKTQRSVLNGTCDLTLTGEGGEDEGRGGGGHCCTRSHWVSDPVQSLPCSFCVLAVVGEISPFHRDHHPRGAAGTSRELGLSDCPGRRRLRPARCLSVSRPNSAHIQALRPGAAQPQDICRMAGSGQRAVSPASRRHPLLFHKPPLGVNWGLEGERNGRVTGMGAAGMGTLEGVLGYSCVCV